MNKLRARGAALAAVMAIAGIARADLIANFDSFQEGQVFDVLTDGGITFYDVFRHQTPYTNFAIENASDGSLGSAFSMPNGLGFGGYVPGSGVAFGAFGGMTFTSNTGARSAGLDFWTLPLDMGGSTVTLTGYREGGVVDSVSASIPNAFSILHYRLDLHDDDYDTFKLSSDGPAVMGDSFLVVDNVTLAAVPEPATFSAFALGAVAMIRRRRRP